MNWELEVLEDAVRDLEVAYRWYDGQKQGLGEDMLEEFDNTCSHLLQYPFAFPLKHASCRQCPLNRFPYVVLYEVKGNSIVVFSVFHTRKRPVA